MPRQKLAYFPFYPNDYLSDSAILALTLEEEGAWLRLTAMAAASSVRGALLFANKLKMSQDYIIQSIICPKTVHKDLGQSKKVLENLLAYGLFREGVDGTIYNRRLLFWRTDREAKDCRGKADFELWLAPRRAITGEEGLPEEFRKTFKTRPAKRAVEKHGAPAQSSEISVQLTNLLIAEMLRNLPTSKVPDPGNGAFTAWAAEVDRMITRDGRDPKEIEKVILFSQRDDFWHKNIRSTAKLRARFEQLQLKMRSDGAEWKKKTPQETDEERRIRLIGG